jgi:hypothetical protein
MGTRGQGDKEKEISCPFVPLFPCPISPYSPLPTRKLSLNLITSLCRIRLHDTHSESYRVMTPAVGKSNRGFIDHRRIKSRATRFTSLTALHLTLQRNA